VSIAGITIALAVTAGFFPLDEQLALWDGHWSEAVARDVVWLGGVASSYAAAAAILQRIGHAHISVASIWRRVQVWGEQFQALADADSARANALPAKWEPPSRGAVADQRMGVAMDGTMIHILQEGWKELKVGTVFAIAVRPSKDERTGELVDLAHAVHNSYVAHLGGPEVFGERVWTEARRRGWEQAQDTEVLGDGAVWIWNQATVHFPDSHQVVDWYHGKQHLAVAAHALKDEGTPAYQRWFNSHETALYQGHAVRIADELEQAAVQHPECSADLRREAGYFRENQHRMNYLEMREEEWPIGSGMVESGGKQYKARFCGPGMRWSRVGTEKLLPIRSAILSKRFDELWTKVYNAPQA
jgi:hypothetical protein